MTCTSECTKNVVKTLCMVIVFCFLGLIIPLAIGIPVSLHFSLTWFDGTILVAGAVLFEVLICSLLLRYVSCCHESYAFNNAECKKLRFEAEAHHLTTVLEDEHAHYEAFPTISQMAAKSNGAYTLNTVGACLAGLVLGYDINRADGNVTLPNLGVLGLLMVLLSPGDQTTDPAFVQKRVLLCFPVSSGLRDCIHNLGFVVFFGGLLGHVAIHADALLHTECHDPVFNAHDYAFLFLPLAACLFLFLFLVFYKCKCCWKCESSGANHPKFMFFLETFSVIFGLMVYFAHSVSSYVMPARACD